MFRVSLSKSVYFFKIKYVKIIAFFVETVCLDSVNKIIKKYIKYKLESELNYLQITDYVAKCNNDKYI